MELKLRTTSPRREVREIEHRLEFLRSSQAAPGSLENRANEAEIQRLEALREMWAQEADEIREARIQHHRRLWRTHQELADRNKESLFWLLGERRKGGVQA